MNPVLTRGRIVATCGIIMVSVPLLFAAAAAADRRSDEELLLWLLGLRSAKGQNGQRVDINSATIAELSAVPGIERHQALRIVAGRPYATLQNLARADFSTDAIARLSRFLAAEAQWPGALPAPGPAPSR
jgi:radical SAM superfamily enzyme with C-terminal helix-hairpin-helix motif